MNKKVISGIKLFELTLTKRSRGVFDASAFVFMITWRIGVSPWGFIAVSNQQSAISKRVTVKR